MVKLILTSVMTILASTLVLVGVAFSSPLPSGLMIQIPPSVPPLETAQPQDAKTAPDADQQEQPASKETLDQPSSLKKQPPAESSSAPEGYDMNAIQQFEQELYGD